jgi:N-acetyltransferase 10
MGYGSRALQLLNEFYEGKFTSLAEGMSQAPQEMVRVTDGEIEKATLLQDNVKIRDIRSMPPLFSRLSEIASPKLDYVGVSYGMTPPLHKFWNAARFVPVYMRQTANDLTGEHTCVMLRVLDVGSDATWLSDFAKDFHRRFLTLLSYQFRTFPSITSLSIQSSAISGSVVEPQPFSKADLDAVISPYDLKRLEKFAEQMVDYHLILDLLPFLAIQYFTRRLTAVTLSRVQESILLGVGLQHKTLDELEKELRIGGSQLHGIFIKIVRKLATHLRSLVEGGVAETIPRQLNARGVEAANGGAEEIERSKLNPLPQSLEEEFAEGIALDKEEKERIRGMIDALPLEKLVLSNTESG